jgi:hypothetical protein
MGPTTLSRGGTLTVGSKALELRVIVLESSSDWQARWQERQEGIGRGRPGTAVRCGQTPEGKTLDVVVGRNKPTRHVVEQTVAGGRNAEDGT